MKKITATTKDGRKVRVSIPEDLANEPTSGHRWIGTGLVRIGFYFGRKWTIVRDYSIWAKKDGTVEGDIYTAYPAGSDDVPAFKWVDLATGNN